MGLPNIGPVELMILIALVVVVIVLLLWRRGPKESATAIPETLYGEEVIVRTFRANSPASAVRWYEQDLSDLVDHGYLPVTQTWQSGEWGFRAFLVALVLLLLFGIGVLVFTYLLVVRPPGTMIVTYVRRDLAGGSPQGI